MKNLITTIMVGSLFTGASAFAGARADLEKVRNLADKKAYGVDVRKEISIFDNSDGNNPCAVEGISYVVKLQMRKAQLKMMPDGSVGQERVWEDFNTYYISKSDLDRGGDLDDGLCQE